MSLHPNVEDRPTGAAIWDGLNRRCPNCHKGALFQGYLKSVDQCAECGEAFHHHRADDGPAYVVILIVAHVIGLAFHFCFDLFNRDPVIMISVLVPLSVGLSLWMLPRVKGGFIALQWAKRMHGFTEPSKTT